MEETVLEIGFQRLMIFKFGRGKSCFNLISARIWIRDLRGSIIDMRRMNKGKGASLLTSKQAYHEAKLYFITASVVFKGHVQGPQPRALPPHALWKLTKLTVHTEVLRPEPDRTATVQYIRDLGIRLHPGVCPKLLDVDLARTWKHDQLGGTRNVEGKHSLGARTLRSAIQSGNFLENHARLNRLER